MHVIEVPVERIIIDEARFPDRDRSHVFEHLVSYLSLVETLPAISVALAGNDQPGRTGPGSVDFATSSRPKRFSKEQVMIDATALIVALEHEYDSDDGFLGLLRAGHFSSRARDRFMSLLATIDLGDDKTVDRRLVALLWYIPLFLQWHMQRLDNDEGDLRSVLDRATTQLERIFGVP